MCTLHKKKILFNLNKYNINLLRLRKFTKIYENSKLNINEN